jgi:hypothetical protein
MSWWERQWHKMLNSTLAYTPSYSCSGSMTFTSPVTTYAQYWQFGKFVFVRVSVTGTLGGTASTDLYISLPITAAATEQLLSAIANDGTPTIAKGYFDTTGRVRIRKPDNSNWSLGAGIVFIVTGVYEAA